MTAHIVKVLTCVSEINTLDLKSVKVLLHMHYELFHMTYSELSISIFEFFFTIPIFT